jgi:hypothetical protein
MTDSIFLFLFLLASLLQLAEFSKPKNKMKRHRSNSYGIAYYNKNCHISFSDDSKRYSENNKSAILPHRQQTDNITLVAIDDEEEQDEHNNEKEEDDDDRFVHSSFLLYLDGIYSRYSPAVILENKGNTARDHLGK